MMILGYFLTVLLMKAYNGDANHLKPKSFRQNQLNRIHSTINSLIKFSLVKSSIDPVFAATDNDLLSLEQAITTTKPVIANSDKLFAFDDVDMAANFIETNCKQLLQFVNQTGRLLYRGDESLSIYNPRLIALKPDLLSPYTYSAAAADYFQVLDSSIDSPTAVKPSRGHLSVSSSMRASQWGPVYSIWPLDRYNYIFSIIYSPIHVLHLSVFKLILLSILCFTFLGFTMLGLVPGTCGGMMPGERLRTPEVPFSGVERRVYKQCLGKR